MYKKIDKPNITEDSKFFFVTFSLNTTNISYSYVKI